MQRNPIQIQKIKFYIAAIKLYTAAMLVAILKKRHELRTNVEKLLYAKYSVEICAIKLYTAAMLVAILKKTS